jgi:hypothetical protein
MKLHTIACLGMLATMVGLTGCASIVSKSKWPVAFKSDPPGAEVVISDDSGKELHRGMTPVVFKLHSGAGYFMPEDYVVEMKMNGYQEDRGVLKAGMNGWYVANAAFGGLIGLLIVDPATGAMWKLPSEYSVNLLTTGALPATNSVSQK